MGGPDQLLRFHGSVTRDPAIDAWMDEQPDELRGIARREARAFRGAKRFYSFVILILLT
jgi:hypothetical protein